MKERFLGYNIYYTLLSERMESDCDSNYEDGHNEEYDDGNDDWQTISLPRKATRSIRARSSSSSNKRSSSCPPTTSKLSKRQKKKQTELMKSGK